MEPAPVVIAGGGPGGCAAALALRRHGRRVLLFDRACFPRDKVCGDVLLPSAQRALAQLNLNMEELKSRAYLCTGARYVAPNGAELDGPFQDGQGRPKPWWVIKRHELDHWLLEHVKAAGAEVREGWEVGSVIRSGQGVVVGANIRRPDGGLIKLDASVVVGADGASSAVARSLGLFTQQPRHLCLAARAYVHGVSLPQPHVEIFTSSRSLPGCGWIIPVGPAEANVGVGILRADAERHRVTVRALFEELRQSVPLMRDRLASATVPPLRGWSLPVASERRPFYGDGFLLVGDAAAFVDPLCGHGIHHALMAGAIAGDVIHQALERWDVGANSLSDYEHRCRAAFLEDAYRGFTLQRLHARTALVNGIVNWSQEHGGVRWSALALLGDAESRRHLLSVGQLLRTLVLGGPRKALPESTA